VSCSKINKKKISSIVEISEKSKVNDAYIAHLTEYVMEENFSGNGPDNPYNFFFIKNTIPLEVYVHVLFYLYLRIVFEK